MQIENIHKSDDGRRLLINCSINGRKMSIINIYAPSILSERIAFFKRTSTWIKANISDDNCLFIAGDFNSVMHPQDRTSNRVDRCTPHLKNILKYNSLIDLFRTKNIE